MENHNHALAGKTFAILATDGFEESELLSPLEALQAAGARVCVIAPRSGTIRGWSGGDWAGPIKVDKAVADASASDYAGLVLPGGVLNADKLRTDAAALAFVAGFVDAHKPVAAICHAAWTLIEGGHVKGRRMTSWKSLKTDLENAGADWVDEEVVVDEGWVTGRCPDDLPAFNAKMVEEFAEGPHAAASARLMAQQHLGELPH